MTGNGKQRRYALRHAITFAVAVLSILITNPVYASKLYIKYTNVDGSVLTKGHEGWSELNSLFLPISASGGGGAGKATFGPTETTQYHDKSYLPLMLKIGDGAAIQTVKVDFVDLIDVKGIPQEFTYFQMEFGTAFLTKLDLNAGTGDPPEVTTNFNFQTLKVTYTEEDPKGGTGKSTSASWDLNNPSAADVGDVANLFAAGLAGPTAVVVPLPASAWLLAAALGAGARLRRRRR